MPDRNYKSYADVTDVVIPAGSVFDPEADPQPDSRRNFQDVLKLSHATRIAGEHILVYGGTENCIDMNRLCSQVSLNFLTLIGGDQCAIVIKGGTTKVMMKDVVIVPSAKSWYDVEIGGWSDQSLAKTTDIVLENFRRADAAGSGSAISDKPVRIVVGRGDWPTIVGGNAKICYVRSYLLKAYWWGKRAWLAVTRKGT